MTPILRMSPRPSYHSLARRLAGLICTLTIAFIAPSCTSERQHFVHALPDGFTDLTRHARLLHLKECDGITFCHISHPWDTASTLAAYLLLPDTMTCIPTQIKNIVDDHQQEIEIVRTPIKHNALTTSCHAYLLELLGGLDRLTILCDAHYTLSPTIREWHKQGKIVEGGNSMSPNTELLYSHSIDAIWISSLQNTLLNLAEEKKMHIIQCADYMEQTPLGRAEWMKFYGRLIGRQTAADSLFAVVENRYLHYRHMADTLRHRPTLLCESIYSGTWFVPGGKSYMSQIYTDAGADYYWSTDDHTGSIALSPEAVFDRAFDCELWLIKTYDPAARLTLSRFLAQNHFYPGFTAAKKGNIFVCNTAFSTYHEETPFRPDLLLQEINAIIRNYNLPAEKSHPTRYFLHLGKVEK